MSLASILHRVAPFALVLAAFGVAAGCGSSAEGDGDDGDDGGGGSSCEGVDLSEADEQCPDGWSCIDGTIECDEPLCGGVAFVGDCATGAATCVDDEWTCAVPELCGGVEAPLDGCGFPSAWVCDEETGWSCVGDVGHDECTDSINTCDPYPEVCDGMGRVIGCAEPECPPMNPGEGTPCDAEGLECEVPSDLDCGPPTVTITCVEGEWASVVPRCG